VRRLLAVGERGLVTELRDAAFDVTPAEELAEAASSGGDLPRSFDAVVAGLDRSFAYGRLAAASAAIRGGARFLATNADSHYPTPVGFLPGAGSIVAAIAAASRATPEVIGKPAPAMLEAIVEAAGLRCGDALMVGDNPDADIVAANRAGIRSVLVLSGVADATTAAALGGERLPGMVVEGPADVGRLLGLVSR
jgi:HAD superfamily hydrolase (TIGR01450 family)